VIRRGFTLLEVLVAISILGLGLTVILSSQVGLFGSAQRAQKLSIATNLLRCRMNEVEENLLTVGFPLVDTSDSGDCCTADEDTPFRCEWKIERVELPQPAGLSGVDADGGAGDDTGFDTGALGALMSISQDPGALGEKPSLESLSEALGGSAAAGVQGMAPLVMGLVYPDLKPMLEASIRKVTVTVTWREGLSERDLSVIQFLTSPQQGGFDPDTEEQLEGAVDALLPDEADE
jgi:general secretion pathway protein I